MRAKEITVTINEYGKVQTVAATKGERLKAILDRAGIVYSLPCAGAGRCGRCRIKFLKGAPIPGSFEEKFLTDEETEEGIRILCRTVVYEDCEVELLESAKEHDISALTLDDEPVNSPGKLGKPTGHDGETTRSYGIAIDLGTTTIAAALISTTSDNPGYKVFQTASCINSQRRYGADVISRISAAEDEETREALRRTVVTDIENLIKELTTAGSITYIGQNPDLKAITITGNTTMLYLLAGNDPKSLGSYPYIAEHLEKEWMLSDIILDNIPDISLTILPGISAFVGADIVAGLFTLELTDDEKFFFLDLGTNGEMAFYDGERLRVTSAAAGPVFEAGGISCGTASIPGAIDHITIDEKDRHVTTHTIGNAEPIGICGTGVMEITSELVKNHIADETGLLTDEYFDDGFPLTKDGKIRFTQQDIRNVQLAKAAIYTGAKTLLNGDIPDKVYVSGGFGSKISPENVEELRMFPREFDGKIVAIGNSALRGAAQYTACVLSGWEKETDGAAKLDLITESAVVTELATTDGFDEDYIAAMNF
ncbi:ASKHA domain-containing protein [Butyrivibrio sp. FCS006]|uniref:ASKHA domain-containing protein n=1 Tax=Butyrivibrio sp. FCS006 TaxID=1280684 RepID=UPI0004221F6B|nr:ASKHA domain-containing protein [Butyrivibrio sp. FCS006]